MKEVSSNLFWFTIGLFVFYTVKYRWIPHQLVQEKELTPGSFVFYMAAPEWVAYVTASFNPYISSSGFSTEVGMVAVAWGIFQEFIFEKSGKKKTLDMGFYTKLMVIFLYFSYILICIKEFVAIFF